MRAWKKAVLMILPLCACVGCDQATKTIAQAHLASSQPVYLMGDVFRFQYIENTGAFLGLGAALPDSVRFWSLIVLVGIVLIVMLGFFWTWREMNPLSIVGGSLFIGGGFSNLLDRLFHAGAVVDFMNFGIGNLRTGIFNFADVMIMVGAGMLLASNLFSRGTDVKASAGQS
jgi:signal peptidase II